VLTLPTRMWDGIRFEVDRLCPKNQFSTDLLHI
jgi:hypothetical protein